MAGSISTLGVGSGLELQSILEQLREVDQAALESKNSKVTQLEAQLEEFDVVKNKLFTLKGGALDLSLESNFLVRESSSSDEDVLSATVQDGVSIQSPSLTISHMAEKSNWASESGFADTSETVYVPTSQESTVGSDLAVGDPDYITEDGSLVVTHGSGESEITISVDVTAGMSLSDVVDAVNADAENENGASTYVTAEAYEVDDENFLRIKSTAGGIGEDDRVMVATQLADVAMAAPDETFEYQIGDVLTSVSVAADTTWTELASLINDDVGNLGVTASIINDGLDPDTPYKFVLKSNETGEDNRIEVTEGLPGITMEENETQAEVGSLNSQFTMDGVRYHRQSNTVNDVITGVTFTFNKEGTSTVSIASNDTELAEKITSMVEAYNDVVQEVSSNSKYSEETAESGILAGTTLRDIPYQLQGVMSSVVEADSAGTVVSMFDLGLVYDRDGTISINQETLTSAIEENRSGVESFFLGDSDEEIEGFADIVNDRLRSLVGYSGVVEGEKSAAQARIDALDETIEEESARIDRKYEQLTKQFVALDSYMNRMTSMSDFLTGQFSSLANGWGSGGDSDK